MTEREILLNAFRPGSGISLPSQFAGRRSEIARLVDALYTEGFCPIVYGDRGLGKSSLALQIERIALGDTELLDELGMPERAIPHGQQFVTFVFSCTDGTPTKDELLQRLINTAEGFSDANSLPAQVLQSRKRTTSLKLRIYESKVAETYKVSGGGKGFRYLSVEEKFEAITNHILETTDRRALFIIDELAGC